MRRVSTLADLGLPASERNENWSNPEEKGVIRNFSWTLAGNVFYGGCQWLIWVILARVGSPVLVGQYSFAQAIVFPLILFSQLQLRSIQATDTSGQVPFGLYLGLRIISTAAAFIVAAGFGIANTRDPGILLVILLFASAKCIESLSDVYFGHLQALEKMKRISISLMIKGALSVVITGLLLKATGSLPVALIGLNAAWLATFVFFDRRTKTLDRFSGRPVWDLKPLLQLARTALPLGITMLFVSLNSSIPRYVLFHTAGMKELGIFSVLNSVQTAGLMVIMALGQAATPSLARSYNDHKTSEFKSLVNRLLGFSAGLGLLLVAAVTIGGDGIISVVFGSQYARQGAVFLVLALASAVSFSNSTLGYAATASRKIRFQPWAYALASLVTAVTCVLWAPAFGVRGAAWSMVAGFSCGWACYAAAFRKACAQSQTCAESQTGLKTATALTHFCEAER